MSQSIFIAGAGQVGAFAAAELNRRGNRLTVVDRAPAQGYFARYAEGAAPLVEQLDVSDGAALTTALQRHTPDVLLLAFGSSPPLQPKDSARSIACEDDAVATCARAAVTAGVQRIVYVSSFAVYGRSTAERLKETDATEPSTPYGALKERAELRLTSEVAGRLALTILRPCGVYGPIRLGCGSHSSRIVDSMLALAASGKPIALEWAPGEEDEYLFAKDLADAIADAVEQPSGSANAIYNVGGARVDAAALGTAIRAVFPTVPIELLRAERDGRRPLPPLDTTKIEVQFGFRPRHDLCAGMHAHAQLTGLIK